MDRKIFWLIFLLTFPLPAFALELQLDWPTITLPGIGTFDIEDITLLHDVARYFYYAFVILGGVVGFIGIIIGGIRWLTSAGNPVAISQSKKQISASFLGLLIILFSWLILYTIDPHLVIFPLFERAVAIPPIEGKPKEELRDGIIFYVENHPLLERIEVPGGLIRVEDTRRFPVGKTYLNLWGMSGAPLLPWPDLPHISYIEIRPRSGLTGPLEDQSRYGVACFEFPHFRGRVRLFIPTPQGLTPCPSLLNPNPDPICPNIHGERVCGAVEFVICQPGAHNPRCGSILVFKIPQGLHPLKAKDWNIFFYQYPFPKRERVNPLTMEKEVVGDCINYYYFLPSSKPCSKKIRMVSWEFNFLNGNDLLRGGFMDGLCHTLLSIDADGNEWYPRSLELPKGEGAASYLIFLFSDDGPPPSRHWDLGDAYFFQSDVDDFYNEKDEDKRLYWTDLPYDDKEDLLPKSCIILPVKSVY